MVMGRGRPPSGPKLVNGLDGSEAAKRRLRVILETLTGQRKIDDACAELGIGKSAFNELRSRVLQGALADLEPKPRGRPKREEPVSPADLAALKAEREDLLQELEISYLREEVMLTFPELFQPETEEERKKKAELMRNRRNRKKRQRKQQQQQRRKQR
jgi:hypothetical protein